MFGPCTLALDCSVEPKRVSEDTLLSEKFRAYNFDDYFSVLKAGRGL